MPESEQLHMSILKQLSEINSSLNVNTNETSNIKNRVSEIQNDVKDTKTAVQIQNGRVTKQEEWSKEAQKIIENTARVTGDYKIDKTRIWAVISVMVFLGGAIITLSIMAIDSKIRDGISEALAKYEIKLEG